jgi:hypothetical protein
LTQMVGNELLRISASFTRPADTTAYASGDLVANSTTAGSVVPLEFTVAGSDRGDQSSVFVTRIRVRKSGTSITNATFRVHLYYSAPVPANGDNAAWSTSKAADYIGSADVVVTQAFTDGSVGSLVPVGDYFNVILNGDRKIYAVLEARGAYTPASAEVFTVSLDMIKN